MRTLRAFALAVAAMAIFGVAPAAADSIVYVQNGDVFLINPDGSGDHQVTNDGNTYWSPSQADDGTITAVKDASPRDKLVRMNQSGQILSEFTPVIAASNAQNRLDDAAISPDGSKIAYTTYWNGDSSCTPSGNGFTNCYIFAVSPSTEPGDLGSQPFRDKPSWMSNSRLMVKTDFHRMATYDLGSGGSVNWFGRDNTNTPGPGDTLYDGEVTASGDKVVTTAWEANTAHGFATSVVFWTTNGPLPAQPTARCRFTQPAGGKFVDPTFSPDGSSAAWEEGDLNDSNAPGADEGIWVVDADVESRQCHELGGGLLVPGGQQPDWGPAAINPPATGTASGGGGGTSTTPTTGTNTTTATTTTTSMTDTTAPVLLLSARGAKLRTVLKKGYTVALDTSESGRGEGSLLSGRTVMAKGSRTFTSAGKQKLVLKFTKKAKKKLARKRSVKLTLRVVVEDAAGNRTTKSQKVTLKR